ncbi:MAG: hypothetical protein VB078_07010 [Clostridiaceae bacterium]|nr:hypothetical protein [Clostridiaceae bacterium]
MNTGKACTIFMEIDRKKYTPEEKGDAINEVLKMPTHNGITQKAMLKVIAWLWNMCFEYRDETSVKEKLK